MNDLRQGYRRQNGSCRKLCIMVFYSQYQGYRTFRKILRSLRLENARLSGQGSYTPAYCGSKHSINAGYTPRRVADCTLK